jgi:hypothetical protein
MRAAPGSLPNLSEAILNSGEAAGAGKHGGRKWVAPVAMGMEYG